MTEDIAKAHEILLEHKEEEGLKGSGNLLQLLVLAQFLYKESQLACL